MKHMRFSRHALNLDAAAESERISSRLVTTIGKTLRRRGAAVGIGGGVDSSVVLGLCVTAFEPERVCAVIMPERESDSESEELARTAAAHFGVVPVLEDISAVLDAFGCYRRRDDAIRRVFPEYDAGSGHRVKITLPQNLLNEDTLNVFSLTILDRHGRCSTKLLPPDALAEIVAASNFKQRARMAMLYHHAELRKYAVVGTANKDEHDLGYFVKYGDGGVDVNPIAHLYKSQVYQLAAHLEVPERIRRRVPTTDTYTAPTTQQEFFFRLPFGVMDLLWFAMDHEVPTSEVSRIMNLSVDQVNRAYGDFVRKRRTTEYLRRDPIGFSEAPSSDRHLMRYPKSATRTR